jgi:hypothetical protein
VATNFLRRNNGRRPAFLAEAGLTLAAMEWVATTAALPAAEWATWVVWAAVATAMARGDFNGGSNWHGRNIAHNGNFARNNWNGNWDRHHHFRNRFFVGAPFFYGGYYAYSGYGNCAWLRRQAIITGSPYWWERYQACLYY